MVTIEGGDVADLTGPPMIALHLLDQRHHLTTHYRVVPV
jgi:hypothetical protein